MKTIRKIEGAGWERITASTPPAFVIDPSTLPLSSPWSTSNLQRVVFSDIYGEDIPLNTRSAAMRLPAIARAAGLLKATIGRLPLQAIGRDGVPVPDQPSWLYRSDDGTSPQLKMAWTVDDLIFYGWSCWWRTNGSDGFPLSTTRINQGDWSVNGDNRVEVDGEVVPDNQVILIPGLHEGILEYGRDALGDARDLYRNVRARIANPVPAIDLHQVEGADMTDIQIDALIDRWAAARAGKNGGVSYTTKAIEAREMGASADAQLMIEGRNAAAVEMARLVGVHAGLVDATAPKASLNYETQTGRNQEFVDFDLQQYMLPITARLSLDDTTPRGQHVAFDLTDLVGPTPAPTGPALED